MKRTSCSGTANANVPQDGPSASHSQTPDLVPSSCPQIQRNAEKHNVRDATQHDRCKPHSCIPLLPFPRPPPSLLTPAALAFHGMANAASHLPPVSRDARNAYRTRISRKPSSPCPHRTQIRLADSPCTPHNTQTHRLPKPHPTRNAIHSPSPPHYPPSLHNHADGGLHNCLCVSLYCTVRRTLCAVQMQ